MRVIEVQKESTKSVSIRFPESLHMSLKRLSKESGISFNSVIVSILSDDIESGVVMSLNNGSSSKIAPDEMDFDPEVDM